MGQRLVQVFQQPWARYESSGQGRKVEFGGQEGEHPCHYNRGFFPLGRDLRPYFGYITNDFKFKPDWDDR